MTLVLLRFRPLPKIASGGTRSVRFLFAVGVENLEAAATVVRHLADVALIDRGQAVRFPQSGVFCQSFPQFADQVASWFSAAALGGFNGV
jgi:hypothetical protein